MITMKDIVREGHPVLREVAKEVTLPATAEEKEILSEMLQFIKNSQDPEIADKYNLRPGVGIAAPQIGISKRMFAVHTYDENDVLYSYGLFNPKMISHSVEENHLDGGEGCLSVDREITGIVPRHARITVKGTTLEGEEVKLKLKGYIAIVFQHELDHLDGIMFYDRIEAFQDKLKKPL
ncbi:peptide deformylase [Alkalihalobacillus alcalophilus ATCC 27647 = CGMCC 1.3604]|uniref:Peptide deformylase n=1 Tax=Alkalihalobacillus alcalophilus ATCC 27647 = CGMCC 1.3604 TaxID=1218173 RepID=A0A094WS40_ALKAL|nr:peptide deformylase [Alkalihalobacillus alcalophilus]KGA98863.1 peptide deformylase [Alkalihalobacillus alcalophilus ATCC 27647 = CGMCC 1.3604]MED1564273.1 peptide deformylase [Alkalihalobacillus alcalophilus]THG91015.1 peptide deformylase [Alkalihalobacillus alcalophilus ATCC 27647 = CGMCC 1.3604]